MGQYHGYWCPGSLHTQVISSHDIDYVNLYLYKFTWYKFKFTSTSLHSQYHGCWWGHQQPWYWPCKLSRSLSYMRKYFIYLCQKLCAMSAWRNDINCKHMLKFLVKNLACTELTHYVPQCWGNTCTCIYSEHICILVPSSFLDTEMVPGSWNPYSRQSLEMFTKVILITTTYLKITHLKSKPHPPRVKWVNQYSLDCLTSRGSLLLTWINLYPSMDE